MHRCGWDRVRYGEVVVDIFIVFFLLVLLGQRWHSITCGRYVRTDWGLRVELFPVKRTRSFGAVIGRWCLASFCFLLFFLLDVCWLSGRFVWAWIGNGYLVFDIRSLFSFGQLSRESRRRLAPGLKTQQTLTSLGSESFLGVIFRWKCCTDRLRVCVKPLYMYDYRWNNPFPKAKFIQHGLRVRL